MVHRPSSSSLWLPSLSYNRSIFLFLFHSLMLLRAFGSIDHFRTEKSSPEEAEQRKQTQREGGRAPLTTGQTPTDTGGHRTTTMEAVEKALLRALDSSPDGSVANSLAFASSNGLDHKALCGAIRSLAASELVVSKELAEQRWVLTAEAQSYVDQGSSPEVQVFRAVLESMPNGITLTGLRGKVGPVAAGVGFKQAMQHKWVSLLKQDKPKPQQDADGEGGKKKKKKEPKEEPLILAQRQEVEDACLNLLRRPDLLSAKDAQALKKRKLVAQEKTAYFSVSKGPKFALERKKEATDLTRDMILGDKPKWRDLGFKKYNFNAMAPVPQGGHLHPLLKVRAQFRKIFLRMGFEEMPTNRFVESSFWNFDALFQPQQHPARDAHDTFFLTNPRYSSSAAWPQDYLERVRRTHEEGGYGSLGYGYNWKLEEAEKNILRTHTTAVSSRMLYQLSKKCEEDGGKFTPTRYFSIDRVFRNESVDRTHLAEFHQCEGLVADRDLSLAHLIGTIEQFFRNIGIPDVKFKPAYNPYTEPSMEIFVYHPGLQKWLEIGNSGIFRPEMLRPMGLPEDVKVIAWGLSLERPTMILYGIDNIRDLFGHKVDLEMMRTNPICRIGLD